jgi:hypothetical protein
MSTHNISNSIFTLHALLMGLLLIHISIHEGNIQQWHWLSIKFHHSRVSTIFRDFKCHFSIDHWSQTTWAVEMPFRSRSLITNDLSSWSDLPSKLLMANLFGTAEELLRSSVSLKHHMQPSMVPLILSLSL